MEDLSPIEAKSNREELEEEQQEENIINNEEYSDDQHLSKHVVLDLPAAPEISIDVNVHQNRKEEAPEVKENELNKDEDNGNDKHLLNKTKSMPLSQPKNKSKLSIDTGENMDTRANRVMTNRRNIPQAAFLRKGQSNGKLGPSVAFLHYPKNRYSDKEENEADPGDSKSQLNTVTRALSLLEKERKAPSKRSSGIFCSRLRMRTVGLLVAGGMRTNFLLRVLPVLINLIW